MNCLLARQADLDNPDRRPLPQATGAGPFSPLLSSALSSLFSVLRPPATLRPALDAFRGDQLRPTLILLVSPLLMLAWKHFGSPDCYRYLHGLYPGFVLWDDPAATGAVYHFGLCFLLLGVVPAMIVKLVFRQRLADYGVRLGDRGRTFRSMLMLAPVFVLAAYFSAGDPAIRAEYPVNQPEGIPPRTFGLHACTYVLFYLGWEFHFRGFLQFGLRGKLGAPNALLVQVMASSLLHIGKPTAETFAAVAGGVLWGLLAFRTRSLLSGLVQHALLGISLDWFICYL